MCISGLDPISVLPFSTTFILKPSTQAYYYYYKTGLQHRGQLWLRGRTSWLWCPPIRHEESLEWSHGRGSPDACLSANKCTGIYYLYPLPTIKTVMSWFNSLGKQAYSSHVSINVNYPSSWSRLRVAPRSRPGPDRSSMESNMLDINAVSNEECAGDVCVCVCVGQLGLPCQVLTSA